MRYKIFVVTNRIFGEIQLIEKDDRDIANILWQDLMSTKAPIITVKDNSFKVWNVKQTRQPIQVKDHKWPEWATKEWEKRKADNYLGARLIDWDNIGCYELQHSTMESTGGKNLERVFYSYKGERLFTVTQRD